MWTGICDRCTISLPSYMVHKDSPIPSVEIVSNDITVNCTSPKCNQEITDIACEMHDVSCHAIWNSKGVLQTEPEY